VTTDLTDSVHTTTPPSAAQRSGRHPGFPPGGGQIARRFADFPEFWAWVDVELDVGKPGR